MKTTALLGMMMFATAAVSQAATFYVKPAVDGGNDSADCASWDTACATLAGAVAKAGTTGDDIYVAGGVYYPASQISLKDKLSIVGGYDPSTGQQNPEKFPTVFSGDRDGNDVTTNGVTLSYTDIAGSNLPRFLYAANLSDVTLEGFTITGMDQTGGNHGSAMWHQTSTITYKNLKFIGNKAPSLGTVLIFGNDNYALGTFEDCYFAGNFAGTGGAINPHRVGHAIVKRTVFENNEASGNGGAIYVNDGAVAGSSLQVYGSTFDGNSAANGGAIMILSPSAAGSIVNTTFINNTATDSGGALRIQNAGNKIIYSTIYNNNAGGNGGGIQLDGAAADALGLKANLILANSAVNTGSNINAAANTLEDLGYNLIGHNGVSGIASGAMAFDSSSSVPAQAENEIVVGDGYYGGDGNSVKITKTSPARNAIPSDGIPFYGVGKSEDYPFVSLQQARGALTRDDYIAGIYYFDLGASYAVVDGDIVFTSGHTQFSTYVDDNGYVLIASADRINVAAGAYASVYALDRRSDAILPAAVLMHADFLFDEVRISSYSGGDRGTFDGYNKSAEVIAKIKQFKTLPNASEPGGSGWIVTDSSSGNNYFLGNARAAGTGDGQLDRSLDLEIYHSSGVGGGIHWIPSRPNEALNWPGGSPGNFSDDLDLWVRSSSGLCDGSIISTDARGLPRSDKVSAEDPVSNCDIGAFEYNDFYRLDCVDEDGLRPENSLESAQVSWCFSDPTALTPRDILDNIGSSNGLLLIIPGLLLVLRRRRLH